MIKIEYLQVQSNGSDQIFRLVAKLEETKNDYYSRYSIELVPLTHTKLVPGAPFTSRHTLFPPRFYFDLKLDHVAKVAKFATRHDVMLPAAVRGCGLGSYAFSRLIEWGQSLQPTYRVEKLKLAEVDARTNEARDQRNSFYKKHGFEFSFSDPDLKTGSCFAESLSLLRPGINSDKVVILDLFNEMSDLLISNEKLANENAIKKLAFERCYSRNHELMLKNQRLWLLVIAFIIFSSVVGIWRHWIVA